MRSDVLKLVAAASGDVWQRLVVPHTLHVYKDWS